MEESYDCKLCVNRAQRGVGNSLSAGCEKYGYLADVAARGIIARRVGFELSALVQLPDPGEGTVQAVFGDQRPDRVSIAPLFVQGAARVEVRLALNRGVDRREASPVVETAVVKDFEQFVDRGVAVSEGIGGLRDQVVVPVAVAQLLLRAGVEGEDAAWLQNPGKFLENPAVGGETSCCIVGQVVEDLLIMTPSSVPLSKGSSSISEE